jgi:hypothetical protein
MPANTWRISNRATAGAAASAVQNAPGGTGTGHTVRILSLQAALAAAAAATTDQLQVLDGATVIWQMDVSAPANTTVTVNPGLPFDLRASAGNNLTVRFLAGGGTTAVEDVNAQGDFATVGSPFYGTVS